MHSSLHTSRSVAAAIVRTFQEFLADSPFEMAGSLSYYTLLSVAPMLMVVLAAAGLIIDGEVLRAEVVSQISDLVGPSSAQFIESVLVKLDQPRRGIIAVVVGLAITVLGATTVFAQLQAAFNRIWHVEAKLERGAVWSYLRQRLLSLGMVLTIAFLLLISLAVSALMAGLQGYVDKYLPGVPLVWRVLNMVVSLGLITVLIAMMFKFLPDIKIEWRDIWFGAFVTSLLFTVGKFLIGLYLGQASVGSAYGAAGSAVVLMVWIYYASLILFFGAKITQVMARQRGARLVPSEHAQKVE